MDITDVRVRKFEARGNMRGIASVTLSNEIVVHDIKIFESEAGNLYIAMPSRKTPSGEFKDVAHPISQAAREMLQEAIISKYMEVGKQAVNE